jgi:hypothetical protein
MYGDTRKSSWFMYYATSRKVAGSIPYKITYFLINLIHQWAAVESL